MVTNLMGEQLPEAPSFKELGMPHLSFGAPYGLYAPKGTPAAKIDDWNRAIRKTLANDEVKNKLINIGYEPVTGSTPEELRALERSMSTCTNQMIVIRKLSV